jgi:two-component system NtrC family sensor kinase
MARHRIGNPTSAIHTHLNNLETAVEQRSQDDALEAVGYIRDSATTITHILNELRRYLRGEPGEFERVEIGPICKDIERHAIASGFQCELSCPPGLYVRGNAGKLREQFLELLTNSTRWCTKEPRRIVLTVTTGSPREAPALFRHKGRFIVIVFEDNGPGIPRGTKKDVFQALYTTYSKGTGMGLTILKQVVEKHGGVVEETGEEGRGVRFVIYLPTEEAG